MDDTPPPPPPRQPAVAGRPGFQTGPRSPDARRAILERMIGHLDATYRGMVARGYGTLAIETEIAGLLAERNAL